MRRLAKAIFTLTLAITAGNLKSNACTNVIVTKGATIDGSSMISYAADSHQLFGELYFAPAGIWKEGQMRKINEWYT